ncbi:MAG: hypothetical protein MUF87_02325 [Anaerolineae bacterium]|jgi:hypothetical protein|nr:hypothetical protein [Anaerolineae bacterium]
MPKLTYTEAQRALGERLTADLKQRGYDATSAPLIAILPLNATAELALFDALDAHQQVIVIVTDDQPLPKLIDHLQPLDFRKGAYPFELLTREIDRLQAPDAPPPMVVLTPKQRMANRQSAIVFVLMALVMFGVGIYLVGGQIVQFPVDEYNLVETERVDQRNTIIAPTVEALLPRSTEQALNFESTLQAAPTRLREFARQTATAIAP